jgi:hypothetical protein
VESACLKIYRNSDFWASLLILLFTVVVSVWAYVNWFGLFFFVGNYLGEYGTKLDIIYDDGVALDSKYSKYIFWNGTVTLG